MHDLSLQIGKIDLVTIAYRDVPDAGRSQIKSDWRSQPTRPDYQCARAKQALLAFDTNFGQENVAAVSEELVVVHAVNAVGRRSVQENARVFARAFGSKPRLS